MTETKDDSSEQQANNRELPVERTEKSFQQTNSNSAVGTGSATAATETAAAAAAVIGTAAVAPAPDGTGVALGVASAAVKMQPKNTSKILNMKDTFFIRLGDWWADLKVKAFLPIKILNFLIYGGMSALFPFLTLQARSIGITESELGIVYAFLPLVALVGPPIAGMIADKIGNFKYFLAVMVFASGLTSLLYMAVPAGRIHHEMPDILPISLSCSGSSSVSYLKTLNKLKCEYEDVKEPVDVFLSSCTSECELARSVLEDLAIAKKFQDELEFEPKTISAAIERIAQVQPSTNFNPAAIYEVLRAEVQGAAGNRTFSLTQNICPSLNQRLRLWLIENHSSSNISIVPVLPVEATIEENSALSSSPAYTETTEVIPPTSAEQQSQDCSAQCRVLVLRNGLCKNKISVESVNPFMTFWLYVIVRILNSVTLATSMPLIEGATVCILKQYDGDYGFQRMYGSLGPLIMTPLSGALIDTFSSYTHTQDYRPAFYLYFAVKLICAGVILMMNLEFKQPSQRVIKDFTSAITNYEICCFLIMCFVAGVCYGAMDTFLFWLLQDMGATKSLMGLTQTVGNLCSLPILLFASPIINYLGPVHTIILGFIFYVIRFIGYSLIYNPWMCMPFEALECFTVALLITAAITYTAELSTPTTTATLQGLMGGLHHGVGRGAGSLVGGFLTAAIGVRRTFHVMAVAASVTAVVYFIVNRIFFRHKALERRQKKLEETETKAMSLNQNEVTSNIGKKDVESCDETYNLKRRANAKDNPAYVEDELPKKN
ncbi:Major facilitator superfamily associated domain [Trinorchestia longiramus]|nr:Major facilitator superfamily associated domain [Trinorchestia longiramus]